MKKAWAYILPTLLCFVLGGLVGWWQNDAIREWYPHLVKPALTPPNAAFPIAWSIIYPVSYTHLTLPTKLEV